VRAPFVGSVAYAGPGDVVAATSWWGLRAYTTAYATGSNPAIDICDSSGANTLTINILASGNLDTAAVTAWSGAPGSHGTPYVKKIYDQVSGNVNYFNTDGAASNPVLSITGGGGGGTQPKITFTAASTHTLETVTTPVSGINLFTFSGVATNILVSGQRTLIGTGTLNPALAYNSADAIFMYMSGNLPSATCTDGAIHSVQAVFNQSSSHLVIDGVHTAADLASAANGSTQALALGSSGNSSRFWSGDFYEIGFWTSDLYAASKTTGLYNNQKAYWGTP
jgi:hypothetical protein